MLKTRPAISSKRRRKRREIELRTDMNWLPDEAVRRFIDDCLVPTMVKQYLTEKQRTSESEE
jgi:hypothetical protein